MSALRNVRMLTRYAAWANSLLYVTLGEQPELELTKPRQIVFGNLIRTLNHVYTIDLVWQAHLEGRAHPGPARRTFRFLLPICALHRPRSTVNVMSLCRGNV